MWVTTASIMELEHPDDGHQTTIIRLGQQTDAFMEWELCRELDEFANVEEMKAAFAVNITRHKLPPIAVTVVTWQSIYDGAKLTDGCTVGRVLYGHGVTDEDKEWQRAVDLEYDEVMAEVDEENRVDKATYLLRQQEDSRCLVHEVTITDE